MAIALDHRSSSGPRSPEDACSTNVGVERGVPVPQSLLAPRMRRDAPRRTGASSRASGSGSRPVDRRHLHHGLVDEAAEKLQDIQLVGAGFRRRSRWRRRGRSPRRTPTMRRRGAARRPPGARRTSRPSPAAWPVCAGRSAKRPGAARRRNRSPRRARRSAGLNSRTRAAASSTASGSPSRCRQISATTAAVLLGQREAVTGRCGALGEELDRVVLHVQRLDRPDPLTVMPRGSRLVASTPHRSAPMQQLGAERSRPRREGARSCRSPAASGGPRARPATNLSASCPAGRRNRGAASIE